MVRCEGANSFQVVRVRDVNSMHGTLLNNELLEGDFGRPLAAGDEITFGSAVYRNQKTFQPATVIVDMEFRTA